VKFGMEIGHTKHVYMKSDEKISRLNSCPINFTLQ